MEEPDTVKNLSGVPWTVHSNLAASEQVPCVLLLWQLAYPASGFSLSCTSPTKHFDAMKMLLPSVWGWEREGGERY